MKLLQTIRIPANTGRAFDVPNGQLLRITATTIVDFVAFNRHDLTERFDQGRTKANQSKIFVTAGDYLISKGNRNLLKIVEDRFSEGRHDLQYGMCSRTRWEWARGHGTLEKAYFRSAPMAASEIPDHGCYENLSEAVAPYGIRPEDIPSPFNIFQNVEFDLASGMMRHSAIRPKPGTFVVLEALMDLLVAISACPDVAVGGKDVLAEILEPNPASGLTSPA